MYGPFNQKNFKDFSVLRLRGEAFQKSFPKAKLSLFSPKYSQFHPLLYVEYIVPNIIWKLKTKNIQEEYRESMEQDSPFP